MEIISNLHKVESFDIIIDDGSHNLSDILNGINVFFKFLKDQGLYIIEDFKHPNYYKYNNNIDHIFIDELLKNLTNKKISKSNILTEISKIFNKFNRKNRNFQGNLADSDISFISKN